MERVTTTQTFGDHTFVVKAYATAREMDGLRKIMHNADATNYEQQKEAEGELIRCLVVSVDGETENLYDYCLDNLDFTTEYSLLIQYLGEVLSKKKS